LSNGGNAKYSCRAGSKTSMAVQAEEETVATIVTNFRFWPPVASYHGIDVNDCILQS